MSSAGLDADRVRQLLGLEPHPTCGFVRISFVSGDEIAPGGLPEPFAGGRPAGSGVVLGDPDALAARYPEASQLIREFTGH